MQNLHKGQEMEEASSIYFKNNPATRTFHYENRSLIFMLSNCICYQVLKLLILLLAAENQYSQIMQQFEFLVVNWDTL